MNYIYETYLNDARKDTHVRVHFEDFVALIRIGGAIKVFPINPPRGIKATEPEYMIETRDELETFLKDHPAEAQAWSGARPREEGHFVRQLDVVIDRQLTWDDVLWLGGQLGHLSDADGDRERAVLILKHIASRI